ncbi:MAG TPA: hypothetical protein VK194_11460, partial [Candidatus Deferrimicrobium sp.]|nr:hypothetical protein [Candidatus Deferrimicrobium sp.]
VGRDPATIERSVEVLVRPAPAAAGEAPEPEELRGSVPELAAALLAYRDLGIAELQVQLRPNTVAAIVAFGPVIEAVRAS